MSTPTTYEPIRAKQVLNAVKSPSMPFDWSINPYRGCQHGCSFCYARSTHTFLGLDTDDTFQRRILVKHNAAEALEAQLQRMLKAKNGRERIGQVALGTATDPYQQVEAKERITRQCLEVLAAYRIPVSITTRSPLILQDAELLKRLPACTVHISLNTLSPSIWRSFEPMSPAPAQRLSTVEALRGQGIEAGVFLAPILPFITDSDEQLGPLVQAVADAGASFVMGSALRLNSAAVKSWFFSSLRQHYPSLVGRYASLYAAGPSVPKPFRAELAARLDALLRQHGLASYRYQPGEQSSRENPAACNANSTEQRPVQLAFDF
ncbi:DNA repair photolyase [Paenibacillus sp. UNCCL117]|uniref:SPL family radical SAM protein n=1 Tax=unclassified Paenibacillus TaxID=185978 RepID=UPI000891D32E|nr:MULTISPECIES: radical SAM protein [unclassified Paenibacillus]SDC17736.1 DNA repair photolyase [Paenibacillus sp. cl123]SFW18063.1 DNA repair photolyase [Paenibacillus sp. UNCCL117]